MSQTKAKTATKAAPAKTPAKAEKPKWKKGTPVLFEAATRTGVRATGSGHVIGVRDMGRAGTYVDVKLLDGTKRAVRPSQLTAAQA